MKTDAEVISMLQREIGRLQSQCESQKVATDTLYAEVERLRAELKDRDDDEGRDW